jgi:hypothetical protein
MDKNYLDQALELIRSLASSIQLLGAPGTDGSTLEPAVMGIPVIYLIIGLTALFFLTIAAWMIIRRNEKTALERMRKLRVAEDAESEDDKPLVIPPTRKTRIDSLLITEDNGVDAKPLFPGETSDSVKGAGDAEPEFQELFSEISHYQHDHPSQATDAAPPKPTVAPASEQAVIDTIEKDFQNLEAEIGGLTRESPAKAEDRQQTERVNKLLEEEEKKVAAPATAEIKSRVDAFAASIENDSWEIFADTPAASPMPDFEKRDQTISTLKTEMEDSIQQLSQQLAVPLDASFAEEKPEPPTPPRPAPAKAKPTSAETKSDLRVPDSTETSGRDEFILRLKQFQENIEKRFGPLEPASVPRPAADAKPRQAGLVPSAPVNKSAEPNITVETLESFIFTANQNKNR